jgi:hypothetical protein
MNQDIAGKYIHEKNTSHYLELKPDGTYFLFSGAAGMTGSFEVNDADITLSDGNSTSRAKIQNGVITDDEGDRWILEKDLKEGATVSSRCPKCGSAVAGARKFCSNCGAVLSAPGQNWLTSEAPLSSISWLPDFLKKELPWELIEAAGWVVVLIFVWISLPRR